MGGEWKKRQSAHLPLYRCWKKESRSLWTFAVMPRVASEWISFTTIKGRIRRRVKQSVEVGMVRQTICTIMLQIVSCHGLENISSGHTLCNVANGLPSIQFRDGWIQPRQCSTRFYPPDVTTNKKYQTRAVSFVRNWSCRGQSARIERFQKQTTVVCGCAEGSHW